jgi:hypothetical protein
MESTYPWATVFKARQEHSPGKTVRAEYKLTPRQRFVVRNALEELRDAKKNKEASIPEAMPGHYRDLLSTLTAVGYVVVSIHHIRGWKMTSDGEVVDYLKMCLAPSHASRTHIL